MKPTKYSRAIVAAIRADFGKGPAGARRVQSAVGCSNGAARRWIDGKTPPNGLYLIRLMAVSESVRAAVRTLTGADDQVKELKRRARKAIPVLQSIIDGKAARRNRK